MNINPSVITPGLYRHYKGRHYRVVGSARHSETQEVLVVYQALYGEYDFWVRPLAMFMENVEISGELVPRFALEEDTAPPGSSKWPE